jgi:hypothetical protein
MDRVTFDRLSAKHLLRMPSIPYVWAVAEP